MALWTQWLNILEGFLGFLSTPVGLGDGLAIIALTFLVRTMLLPLAWPAAYRGCIRQRKLARLQPELQRLKEELAAQPTIYTERLAALYRKNGMTLADGRALLSALVQLPILLGVYNVLRKGLHSRFLWVGDLSRPDPWFAVLAGLATVLLMSANPDLPEQMRLLLLIVPGILTVVVALKVASALSLYWTATNCYSAIQTTVLHRIVARRVSSGALKI
ncbi:MAG TPA: membrane protein insertase YidC [Steroidobacteraceae bacterium]